MEVASVEVAHLLLAPPPLLGHTVRQSVERQSDVAESAVVDAYGKMLGFEVLVA
jgi:hypothetical protein